MAKFYMDDHEIAASYRTAANKTAQITVLVELNACSKRQMREKLKICRSPLRMALYLSQICLTA